MYRIRRTASRTRDPWIGESYQAPPAASRCGRRAHGRNHVPLAQRHDPEDRQGAYAGGLRSGEGRLACHQLQERLEQQRDAGGLAAPGRGDLYCPAVGQRPPRKPHLEPPLVPEYFHVPPGLGRRIMDRMLPALSRYGKAACDLEIDADIELSLDQLEVHRRDKRGAADAECLSKILSVTMRPFSVC